MARHAAGGRVSELRPLLGFPWFLGLTLLALGCGSKHAPLVLTPELAQLAGTWTLNQEASDDPQKVLKELRPSGGPGGMGPPKGGGPPGGFPPGGGGPSGGFGGGPPGGKRGPGGAGPGDLEKILRASSQMEISLTDSTAAFQDSAGVARIFYVDGRKTVETMGRATLETKVRWKDESLVLERKMSGGGKVTETYSLEPESRQLHVITELAPPWGEKVRFRRVYDRGGSAP